MVRSNGAAVRRQEPHMSGGCFKENTIQALTAELEELKQAVLQNTISKQQTGQLLDDLLERRMS